MKKLILSLAAVALWVGMLASVGTRPENESAHKAGSLLEIHQIEKVSHLAR